MGDGHIGLMAAPKSSDLPMTVKHGGLILPSKRKRNRSLKEEDMAHAQDTLDQVTDRRDLVTSTVARSFTGRIGEWSARHRWLVVSATQRLCCGPGF